MGDYADLGDWEAAANNPSAPRGVKTQAEAGAAASQGATGGYANLGAWTAAEGFTGAARGWYSGQYVMGQGNGWDTRFMADSMKQFEEQQAKALETGDFSVLYDRFDRDDATGVVAWDDPEKGLKFGDVYSEGKLVGNLYKDYDRKTANLMMAEHVLDPETKQQIFSDMGRDGWLEEEITKVQAANTDLRTNSEAQQAFKVAVEERKDDLVTNGFKGIGADEGLVLGGAAGGATVGAGIGSFFPGAGTVIGGVAGSIVGGVGAWMNKDLLTEQTARALEISSMAGDKYSGFEEWAVKAKEFGGIGLRLLQPMSNLTQGIYDANAGVIGDGKAEFYAIDSDGERKVPTWVKVADLTATLADSVGTFGTRFGAQAYVGATGAHAAGSVGLMASQDAGWSDYSASFDDYEGAKEHLAAWSNVGIDVLQMGFAGALVRGGRISQQSAGGMIGQDVSSASWRQKLPTWSPGYVPEGAVKTQTIGGMKFFIDDAGTALAARPTIEMLVPSEILKWMPLSAQTRWRAAASKKDIGGPGTFKWAVSPDDFYMTAREMARGQNRFGAAFLNGWAEGGEEAVQAVLEPTSFSEDLDAGRIFESFFYGLASGAGMSLGSVSRRASTEEMDKARISAVYEMRYQTPLDDAAFKALGRAEKERLREMTPDEESRVRTTLEVMNEAAVIDHSQSNSLLGTWALREMKASKVARDLANVNPGIDTNKVLGGMSTDKVIGPNGEYDGDAFSADSSVNSFLEAIRDITNLHEGMALHPEDLKRRIDTETAKLAQAQAAGNADAVAASQSLLDQFQAEAADIAGQIEVNEAVRKQLRAIYNRHANAAPTDIRTRNETIDEFNDFVRNAYRKTLTDEQGMPLDAAMAEKTKRAVEVLYARHPVMGASSFVYLMPQVSKALSRANAHGFAMVHNSVLKALGADHDGDTKVSNDTKYVPAAQRAIIRAGSQYIAPKMTDIKDGLDNVVSRVETFEVVSDPPDGESLYIRQIAAGFDSGISEIAASATYELETLVEEMWQRYRGFFDHDVLVDHLARFEAAVRRGDTGARMELLNGLVATDREALVRVGMENETAEIPFIQQRISLAWSNFEVALSQNSPDNEYTEADLKVRLSDEKAFQLAISMEEAANEAQSASNAVSGVMAVRKAQKYHYSVYRAAIEAAARGQYTPELVQEFTEAYAAMASGMHQSKLADVRGKNDVQRRVIYWMQETLKDVRAELNEPGFTELQLANIQVRDYRVNRDGSVSEHDVSFLQMLLSKSLDVEERAHAVTSVRDKDFTKKISQLRRLTDRDPSTDKGRSTTAQQAMLEIYGAHPLHELLSVNQARYLGPHLTMNQLIGQLVNKDEESRQQQLFRWKRKAPYVLALRMGNPPYTHAEITDTGLSPYRLLVDTISVGVTSAQRRMRDQDNEVLKSLTSGIENLQNLLHAHRRAMGTRLKSTDTIAVLNDLLSKNPRTIQLLASIFPEGMRHGAFELQNGQVGQANWINEMLEATPERAAAIYVLQSKLAEWNQLGGVNLDGDRKGPVRGFNKIQSRILQTFYVLAREGDGLSLTSLLTTMREAPSVPAMMEQINKNPAWRGNRAELLAFFDDVGQYDSDPSEVWSSGLPGTLQREAIAEFAQHTQMLTQSMVTDSVEQDAEKTLIAAMLVNDADPARDIDGGARYYALLKEALVERGIVPDHTGPRARDQFHAAVQDGNLRIHDKGKPDDRVSPFGEALVLTHEFGVKQAVFQNVDAITHLGIDDVLTNPSKLAQGPTRVDMKDGSFVTLDFSTPRNVLLALDDPATNAIAKMVLYPIARELNTQGNLMAYADVGRTNAEDSVHGHMPSLMTVLENAKYADLFPTGGGRPNLAQAHKLIAMAEAKIAQDSLNAPDEERAKAYYPITRMISEFLVAYTHRDGYASTDQRELDELRESTYINVAYALMQMAALHGRGANAQGERLTQLVDDALNASLKQRWLRDNSATAALLETEADKIIEDVMVVDAHAVMYQQRREALTDKLTDPKLSLTDIERETMQAEIENLDAKMVARVDHMKILRESNIVQAAINMYSLTGDRDVDDERKIAIYRAVSNSNKWDKWNIGYELSEKLLTMIANRGAFGFGDKRITEEEWAELGATAATIYLSEMSGRSGSSVEFDKIVLGAEGAQQRRYFDFTWSYLKDGLMDPVVLDAVGHFMSRAKFPMEVTNDDVAGSIEGSLFNPDRLGKHTDLVISESAKAEHVLGSVPLKLAIAAPGILPVEIAAVAGTARRAVNPTRPPESALTPFAREWERPAVGPQQRIPMNEVEAFKLDRSFAGSVILKGQGLPPEGVDLLTQVGEEWHGDESVRDSGYRMLTLQKLFEVVDSVLDSKNVTGKVSLEIGYFDVDTKPEGREWANSVYYDGGGRSGSLPSEPDLISEMVTGVGALNTQGQQNPLNFATKKGTSYKPTSTIPLATALEAETGDRVADVIFEKARILFLKEYDVGRLHAGDLRALYKLLKYHHVIKGVDAEGNPAYMWSSDAIGWETANDLPMSDETFPIKNARLVPISEAVMLTLLNEPGEKGTGAFTTTQVNLANLDVAPPLDAARLERLGLTRLGEEVSLADSGFAGLHMIGKLKGTPRADTKLTTRFEKQITQFEELADPYRIARGSKSKKEFDRVGITTRNAAAAHRMFGAEGLSPLLARLGIPFTGGANIPGLKIAQVLMNRLLKLKEMDGSSVIWQHRQQGIAEPDQGIISRVQVENEFANLGYRTPIYKDQVILDMEDFLTAAGRDYNDAYDQLKTTIRAYAKNGVTIILASSAGTSQLREQIGQWINSGVLGYAPMADSQHFFAPISPRTQSNQTRRALDSSLGSVEYIKGDSVILTLMSDFFDVSENASYLDLRPEQPVWRAITNVLMPTQVGTVWGRPFKGSGQADQFAEMKNALLPFLRSPDALAHLKKIGAGNPPGVPLYKIRKNGTIEPGVLSLEDAVKRLADRLEADRDILTPNEEIMLGDFVPLRGPHGTLLLTRVGFQLPEQSKMDEQLATPLNHLKPTDGEPGLKVAVAVNKLQANWTVKPPGQVVSVQEDRNGGLSVTMRYSLSRYGKGISEAEGWKTLYSPLPNWIAGPVNALSRNGLRFNAFTNRKARDSKEAERGSTDNFKWLFALTGMDFRQDMIDLLLGPNRSEENFADDWNTVKSFLDKVATRKPGWTNSQIAAALDTGGLLALFDIELNAMSEEVFGRPFTYPGQDTPWTKVDPKARLGQIILAQLMSPGIEVEHVIGTRGLINLEDLQGGGQVQLLPDLMTDAFNSSEYPDLRELLIDRANSLLPTDADGVKPYVVGYDMQMRVAMTDPRNGKRMYVTGVPAISFEFAAEENPVNYAQARVRQVRQGESQHVSFESFESISARTLLDRDVEGDVNIFDTTGLTRFEADNDTGGFWRMMRAVPNNDTTYQPWLRRNPMQRFYYKMAYAKYKEYHELVSTEGWTDQQLRLAEGYRNEFITELNLSEADKNEFDYLVRQYLGARAPVGDEPSGVDEMTAEAYLQAAGLIVENIRDHMNPLEGGIVPLPGEPFLKKVFDAQRGKTKPWAPIAMKTGRKEMLADTYQGWINSIIGQIQESESEFISVYAQDLDGFWASYEGATADLTGLPVSFDQMTNVKLMDATANDMFVSLDPTQRNILANPVIFDSSKKTMDAILHEHTIFDKEHVREVERSPLAHRIARINSWRHKNGIQKEKKKSVRSYMETGAWYQQSKRETNVVFSGLINVSVGMRLANPALYFSAFVEVPFRNMIEGLTDVVMGEHAGKGGQTLAKGQESKYSPQDIRDLEDLSEKLGNDNEFLALIYDELMFKHFLEAGHGKFSRGTEKFARAAAKATADPTFGMTAKTVARRYVTSALAHLEASGVDVDVKTFVSHMNRNSMWLRDQYAKGTVNPHQSGLNRIAQVRGVKASVPSKTIMGLIDSASASSNSGVNLLGFLLKVPFLFTRFNAGAFITLSGMGGFDQMAAMMLHKRESKFVGGIQKALLGERFDPSQHGQINMSDVIEGLDLVRPFVRGGVTHTGLMAFGMMASGIGLTGEDEEARRRRKLAQYMRTPLYYDPRSDYADFRNADAIYLDFLPDQLQFIFGQSTGDVGVKGDEPRTRIVPHWIFNQFLSPVVGMERFFETGDLRQIRWGFEDAIGVIPYSVPRMWNEAKTTVDALQAAARDSADGTDVQSIGHTNRLLLTIASVYEKALFESSFVNSVRASMDEYDRNPWVIPEMNRLTDEIKRDPATQTPLPTGSLTQWRDAGPDKKMNTADDVVRSGYTGRDEMSAFFHQYAENNLTAALLSSLFTGQVSMDSTFFRQNMVPKEVKISIPDTTKEVGEALILAAIRNEGGYDDVTVEELVRTRIQANMAAGRFESADEMQAWAEKTLGNIQKTDLGLTVFEGGNEVLTKEGQASALLGLAAGTVELGDASLRGFFLTPEMRDELEEEWTTELIQSGIDMGLDETTAKARAKRIWYGDSFGGPDATGLREILWSDKIPWNGDVKYRQLNTTFMLGPDGLPWATGFQRQNLLASFGIPWPDVTLSPAGGGLTIDERGNTVDPLVNINTGGRALERIEETWAIKPSDKGLEKALGKEYQPGKKTGSSFSPYGRRGYSRGGGGGGGYSSSGYPNFTRMYQLPEIYAPYGNAAPYVNTSNPILRRSQIRRERVWSERGRLKPWQ